MKSDSTGLGKITQDMDMIDSTVAQRRELDSERQIKESEEQKQAREVRLLTYILPPSFTHLNRRA
jgi:hypothetical protein